MNDTLKILIIAAVGLLAVCVCWFLFFYNPKVSKVRNLKNETGKLLDKLESFKVTDDQIDDLETSIDILRVEISHKQKRLIPKKELRDAMQQIQKHGKKFGLKFHKIIPDYDSLMAENYKDQTKSAVIELTVHLKLQGKYKPFGRFLESLDDLPFLISIGELTMAYNERKFPELEILLDLTVYMHDNDFSNIAVY